MADGSDIVERLRELAKPLLDGGRWSYPAATLVMSAGRVLHEAADLIERLRAQAPGWRMAMEAAASVADEAAMHEREEITEAKRSLGKAYDHNSYGAGYEMGALATAENIAEAIRALPSPPAEGGMCSPASGLGGPASDRSAK